ncbi:MAG: SpoIID/LytB domain-containing protein [Bacillota bacterium]|nr:SpoIID/LytB domain-containing protein [Bacillota bacterium]
MRQRLTGLIALGIVVLITTGGLAVVQRRDASAALKAFVDGLAAGRMDLARAQLAPGVAAPEDVLASLSLLARNTAPRIDPDVRADWSAFLAARELSVPLVQPEDLDWIRFGVRRTAAGWKVDRLPDLLAHPGALLTVGPGGETSILIHGRQVDIAGAGAIETGRSVGLAVVRARQLLSFQPATAVALSELLRVVPGQLVETEREGALAVGPNPYYYDVTGEPTVLPRLIPGSTRLTAYLWQGQVHAVTQSQPFRAERIRVALNTTGFAGLEHTLPRISSSGVMTVADRLRGKTVTIRAGAQVVFRRAGNAVVAEDSRGNELIRGELRLHVLPAGGERLTANSLTRGPAASEFVPSYRGRLEVAVSTAAGLVVVNELPLNEYLYSVVPSEMPVAFGLEALKVQSMAARAYAVASMLRGGYDRYGAHVDDSVSSQVYNNVREQAVSNQAVDETRLQLPVYGGAVVDARFFSTSSGFTANAHEVWSREGQFPSTPVPYLAAVPQTTQVRSIPDEAAMEAFINMADLDAPDAAAPFFRWSVAMTRAEVEASLRVNLRTRYTADPSFVLTRTEQGDFVSRPIPAADPIGTLQDLRVVQRGQGGNIMALDIVGTGGTYRIVKEYNVRFTLRPVQYAAGRPAVLLALRDGSLRSNYPILPSAFAVFQMQRDSAGALAQVTVKGGGNGHGAGMSQTGAQGLAERGMNYADIVRHYYQGAEIVDLTEGDANDLQASGLAAPD